VKIRMPHCNATTYSKSISSIFEITAPNRQQPRSVGRGSPNQVVRMGVVKLVARALIEHVRIDPIGP
jgi:hypothetical protein